MQFFFELFWNIILELFEDNPFELVQNFPFAFNLEYVFQIILKKHLVYEKVARKW